MEIAECSSGSSSSSNDFWAKLVLGQVPGEVQEAAFLAIHGGSKRQNLSKFKNDYAISTSPQERNNKVDNLAGDPGRIQALDIMGQALDNHNDELHRAVELSEEVMKKKKWILILDDLWDSFELHKVGIPSFRGTLQGVNLSLINGGINGGVDTLLQVEAKYPVLLFKQQLTA
uniref:NB-ARC domain-containing protein n=1 Tax=Salix viminalis TaxID=40686 RepID=A0A6N2KV64_SALVM